MNYAELSQSILDIILNKQIIERKNAHNLLNIPYNCMFSLIKRASIILTLEINVGRSKLMRREIILSTE